MPNNKNEIEISIMQSTDYALLPNPSSIVGLHNPSHGAQIPDPISLNRFKTLNGFGFIFLTPSPLLIDFIESEAHSGAVLMEVGAGFGNTPIEALKRNIDMYTANDISEEHLDILKARALQAFQSDKGIDLKKLQLLCGKAPNFLPKFREYYDAILIDKTLHFFTPDEVEDFLRWAYEALKPQGHIYILTISPYILCYREKVLPFYMQNKEENSLFPGYIPDADSYLREEGKADTTYCVPKNMLFFTLEDLCSLLEKRGFTIEKTYSISLPSEDKPDWTEVLPEESSLVGLKVQKKL